MGLVDTTAFDHKEKAFLVLRQDIDRLCRHVSQRWFVEIFGSAIFIKFEVRRVKKA